MRICDRCEISEATFTFPEDAECAAVFCTECSLHVSGAVPIVKKKSTYDSIEGTRMVKSGELTPIKRTEYGMIFLRDEIERARIRRNR